MIKRTLYDSINFNSYLDTALGKLRPRFAEAVRLRHTHNLTFEKIGNRLGVGTQRANQIYYHAVGELRILMFKNNLRPSLYDALSVRAANCLKNAKITNIETLLNHTEEDLLYFKNFGQKSLLEIKEYLSSLGLSLGQPDKFCNKCVAKIKHLLPNR